MEVEFAEHGESDAGGDEKHDEEELEAARLDALVWGAGAVVCYAGERARGRRAGARTSATANRSCQHGDEALTMTMNVMESERNAASPYRSV